MDHKESDQASNDATTILSELLSSTEVVHHSQAPTTATLAQDKIEKNLENNSLLKGCDNEDIVNPLKNNEIVNNMGYTNMDDISKIQQIRHVHIPYILNGELYQIQTQDGENVTVKCCHCPPDRVYRGSVRSTGNFHMHIKRRHPDLLEKLHDMKVNALLERRDRLMRNRKITQRNNRNRPLATAVAAGAAPISSFKSEPTLCTSVTPTTSQLSLTSTPELSLMHTHNLKIKTVFQRHQMQQKEAAEMRNWNNVNYAVMPMAKLPTNESIEEPINYSLKTQENNEETHASSTTSYSNQQQEQQQQQEQYKHQNNIQTCENYADLSKQPTNSSIATEHNELIYQTNDRNFSTSSISVSCPSVMSSYSSNQHYSMETAYQYNNLHNPHNLSIIKPENLGMESENEVLDLSMHTESGIFLNSTITSDNSINNNSENNDINDNRAGSQLLSTANTTAAVVAGASNHNNSTCSSNITANNNSNTKWQELLMQVETSLRDVQREMNVRNHIESNRMFLDIAKFKFLHPSFQFNW